MAPNIFYDPHTAKCTLKISQYPILKVPERTSKKDAAKNHSRFIIYQVSFRYLFLISC